MQASSTGSQDTNARTAAQTELTQLNALPTPGTVEDPAGGLGPHANLRGPAYYH